MLAYLASAYATLLLSRPTDFLILNNFLAGSFGLPLKRIINQLLNPLLGVQQ